MDWVAAANGARAIGERPLLLTLGLFGLAGAAATGWLVESVRADIESGVYMPARPEAEVAVEAPAPEPAQELPFRPVEPGSYFPASGSVVWGHDGDEVDFALAYDELYAQPVELLLSDDSRGYNHVLRFYRRTAHGSRLFASLHLAEGGRARIDLPNGTYGIELLSRPVGADYERAFGPGARGRFLRTIDLRRPASSYRLGPMLLITGHGTTMYVPGVWTSRRA